MNIGMLATNEQIENRIREIEQQIQNLQQGNTQI